MYSETKKRLIQLNIDRNITKERLHLLKLYLPFADGEAYTQDCSAIAKLEQELQKVEAEIEEAKGVSAKVSSKKECEDSIKELKIMLFKLDNIGLKGDNKPNSTIDTIKELINVEIDKLNSRLDHAQLCS